MTTESKPEAEQERPPRRQMKMPTIFASREEASEAAHRFAEEVQKAALRNGIGDYVMPFRGLVSVTSESEADDGLSLHEGSFSILRGGDPEVGDLMLLVAATRILMGRLAWIQDNWPVRRERARETAAQHDQQQP